MEFKTKYKLLERKEEANKILMRYPDKIPIICEKKMYDECTPNIDKIKYLVSKNIRLGQFIYIIKKRLKLSDKKALSLFINGKVFINSLYLSDIYINEKDEDGFLYIIYATENTFG